MTVEQASANPCAAKRSISVSTRRCASIAKASSNSTAASRLISCDQSGIAVIARASASEQQIDQHSQHGEQERGTEELRRSEDAQLGRDRLDQRQGETARGELDDQHRNRADYCWPVSAATGNTEREEKRDPNTGVVEELKRRR